jgi:hypothetical protein
MNLELSTVEVKVFEERRVFQHMIDRCCVRTGLVACATPGVFCRISTGFEVCIRLE